MRILTKRQNLWRGELIRSTSDGVAERIKVSTGGHEAVASQLPTTQVDLPNYGYGTRLFIRRVRHLMQ